MSKFYNLSWKEFGLKYIKMLEAAGDRLDDVMLTRQGYNGNIFSKTIAPGKDLKSEKGFMVRVRQRAEVQKELTDILQGFNAARTLMPNNIPLMDLYKKRVLELTKVTPEEERSILAFEKTLQTSSALPTGIPGSSAGLPGLPAGMFPPPATMSPAG